MVNTETNHYGQKVGCFNSMPKIIVKILLAIGLNISTRSRTSKA